MKRFNLIKEGAEAPADKKTREEARSTLEKLRDGRLGYWGVTTRYVNIKAASFAETASALERGLERALPSMFEDIRLALDRRHYHSEISAEIDLLTDSLQAYKALIAKDYGHVRFQDRPLKGPRISDHLYS